MDTFTEGAVTTHRADALEVLGYADAAAMGRAAAAIPTWPRRRCSFALAG